MAINVTIEPVPWYIQEESKKAVLWQILILYHSYKIISSSWAPGDSQIDFVQSHPCIPTDSSAFHKLIQRYKATDSQAWQVMWPTKFLVKFPSVHYFYCCYYYY